MEHGDVMDPDIRELQEKAKELRVASEQLEWQIQLFAAQTELLEETRWLVMEGEKLLCESPVCVARLHEDPIRRTKRQRGKI